jgi:hypothetical protein
MNYSGGIPDIRPVIEWQRARGDGGIFLCDPFLGNEHLLDPNQPLLVMRNDISARPAIEWLQDPARRTPPARMLGMTMLYGVQDNFESGGRNLALEATVLGTRALGQAMPGQQHLAGADVYLYTIANGNSVRPDEPQPADSFEARIASIISRKDAPPSAQISLKADTADPLDLAILEMSRMVDEIEPDDPLNTIGNLVVGCVDRQATVVRAARQLMIMSEIHEDAWREKPGLRVAVSAHADDTDLTRIFSRYPGVAMGTSDFVDDPNIPSYMREELVAEVAKNGFIPAWFFE